MIAGAVLAFHALAIWALQSGLLMRAVEMVVPVEVIAQIIEPPKPVIPPPPVVPKEPPPPVKQAVVKPAPPVPQMQALPQILAVETPTPAPSAPAPVQIAAPAPILPPSVPVAAVATPSPVAVPVATAKVLPSTDADDLYNPNQRYPRMSQTMGEQGTVMVRILIGANGLPLKAELQKTSGFERLDQAALDFVMQSRYKPGTLGGKPTEMWMGREVKYILRQ